MDNKKMCTEPECENVEYYSAEEEENSIFTKRVSLEKFVIGLLILIIVFMAMFMWQHDQNRKLETEEAYLISMMINLQEDNLLLGYGLFPSDVGLEKLQSTWINNPCYDTAYEYSEALGIVLEELSGGKVPDVFVDTGAMLQV